MAIWHTVATALGATFLALLASGILVLLPVVVYRAFFHPLAKYPGPLLGKFTNLYAAYHSWKGDIHKDMYRCHMKYGDRVRYSPNRVMVNSAEAVQDVYGHGNNCKKFEGYKVLAAHAPNTLTMSDKVQHARRRRVLSQAFSEASLRLFEPTLRSRIDRFCNNLQSHSEPGEKWTRPLDMSDQFNRLAFDMMTATAFGTDFDTIDEPKYRYVIKAIEEANVRLGVISQALELTTFNLDRRLFLSSAIAAWKFGKFLSRLLRQRLEAENTGSKDLFSFLQKCQDPETGKGLTDSELSTETATFVVAGSDTTSTTMSMTSHYLSGSSRCYRRACEEVRTTFASADEICLGAKLNSCVFLRACIDEALRLSPPGGSVPWREVDRGGATIAGDFFPEGCEIGVATYTIHHNLRHWDDPFSYTPERWLASVGDKEKRTGDASGRRPFIPFSIGPRSCVGKPLAYAQAMLALARLIWEFDFRRADSDEYWETKDIKPTEYELKEHITSHHKGPILCLKSRV